MGLFKKKTPAPQFISDKDVSRADHIWFEDGEQCVFKCVLCGAVTYTTPPDYPTPENWQADIYQPLDDRERMLRPYQ